MSTYYNTTCHIKIKLNGNAKKIEAFNFIAGLLDGDYPFAPKEIRRSRPGIENEKPCPVCGGALWVTPSYGIAELQKLASQLAASKELPGFLKMRVRSRVDVRKCEGDSSTRSVCNKCNRFLEFCKCGTEGGV